MNGTEILNEILNKVKQMSIDEYNKWYEESQHLDGVCIIDINEETMSNNKSKNMCYILRHNPDGYNIDEFGFINIDEFINKLNMSKEILLDIVNTDNKNRYEIIDNKIRCRQGHSIDVILNLEEKTPPELLLHGTTDSNMKKIFESKQIKKMNRHHVHLSDKFETAKQVAQRHHDNPVVLVINTLLIPNKFYLSSNGVWLTDNFSSHAIVGINHVRKS